MLSKHITRWLAWLLKSSSATHVITKSFWAHRWTQKTGITNWPESFSYGELGRDCKREYALLTTSITPFFVAALMHMGSIPFCLRYAWKFGQRSAASGMSILLNATIDGFSDNAGLKSCSSSLTASYSCSGCWLVPSTICTCKTGDKSMLKNSMMEE